MSEPGEHDRLLLGADTDLLALGERLRHERPVPSASFRGELGRRIVHQRVSVNQRRRARSLLAIGLALLALAALGLADVGPLSPERQDARAVDAVIGTGSAGRSPG